MSDAVTFKRTEREPMVHELKTWRSYFHSLADGSKTFEIRRNDRDFRIGDELWLRETCSPGNGSYTGRETRRTISHILTHEPEFGLMDGFAILSFAARAGA